MISQFALNKALLDKLNSITALDIAVQGSAFTPSPSGDYIAEKEVPTSVDITLGAGRDTQRGFYQVTIATPIIEERFYHLRKVDELTPLIGKGLAAGVEFDSQKVSISTITPSGMYSDDTHLKTALTIAYTVIA
mgnify:CR=1 FL=1